jgi:hypothetical protein
VEGRPENDAADWGIKSRKPTGWPHKKPSQSIFFNEKH